MGSVARVRGRSVIFVLSVVFGVLFVAACGADDAGSTEPATTEPTTTGLATTEPVTPEPATTEPATTEPATTEPATTEPATTEPRGAGAPISDSALDRVPDPEASTVGELLALVRPVVAAHAGGDFDFPHSTMFAYAEAALAGTDVLEMDVMLTADGVLVVHHDDTVDRTTETSGVVRDLTYTQLEVLDNAYWFSGDVWVDKNLPDESYVWRGVRTGDRPPPEGYLPDDFRIETFASVSEAFPAHVLDVEIKVQSGADGEPDLDQAFETARVLADEIERLDRTDSVIVVSFDDRVIEMFRTMAPEVATSPGLDILVAWYTGAEVEFAVQDVVFQVPPVFEGIEVLTADTVQRAHDDGFDVWAWMSSGDQENAEFYRELTDRGVDGLIVARPAEAVSVARR